MAIDPVAVWLRRRGAALVLLAAAASCGQADRPVPAPAAPPFAFPLRVGWLHGSCLAIDNPALAHGVPVTLVVMAEPQTLAQARIAGLTTSPEGCPPLMPGRAAINATKGVSFYTLEGLTTAPTDMAIGIVEPPAPLTVSNGVASADLDRDGRPEVFSSCATTEGIKFAIWSGKTYQGEPRWSAYYYLDYDSEPSCP